MREGNQTLQISYRYLTADDFKSLHETFLEAYSDYFFPVYLTESQLEHHIRQNSVELTKSVGAFAGEKLVGMTLNGFGSWNGVKTVYDAGTGVIPEFRNRGIGRALFEFMTPDFEKEGFRQMLLEVLAENEKATRLYEKLGFAPTRELIFFEQKKPFRFKSKNVFEIRELAAPDWELFETFADGSPSWQYSRAAIENTRAKKIVLGSFFGEKCVGYAVASRVAGMVSQIAVAPEHRRRGAASQLFTELQKRLEKEKIFRVANVHASIKSAVEFFRKCGFSESFRQIEMIKLL